MSESVTTQNETRGPGRAIPYALSALFLAFQPTAIAQEASRVELTRDALGLVLQDTVPVDARGQYENTPMFQNQPRGTVRFASFQISDQETGRNRLVIASVAMQAERPTLFIETCYTPRELRAAYAGCDAYADGHMMFNDNGIDGTLDFAMRSNLDESGGVMNEFYYGNQETPASDRARFESEYDTLGLGSIQRHIAAMRARDQI